MRVRVSLAAPNHKFNHSGFVISTFAKPHSKSFIKNSLIFGSITLTKANGKGSTINILPTSLLLNFIKSPSKTLPSLIFKGNNLRRSLFLSLILDVFSCPIKQPFLKSIAFNSSKLHSIPNILSFNLVLLI